MEEEKGGVKGEEILETSPWGLYGDVSMAPAALSPLHRYREPDGFQRKLKPLLLFQAKKGGRG